MVVFGRRQYGRFDDQTSLKPEDIRMVSFQPLNHIAAFMYDVTLNIMWGS